MDERSIYSVIEFYGDGDPAMGGSAADWGLYVGKDGRYAFMSQLDALQAGGVHAYFPTKDEAQAKADASSVRGGSVCVLEKRLEPRIPAANIQMLVGNMHVASSDDEVSQEVVNRLSGSVCRADAMLDHVRDDILAQAAAYALACHRANQDLVSTFRL